MGCEADGVPRSGGDAEAEPYALVIYVPGLLGRFLDELRRELIPHYNPHAHMTVLPPRSLSGGFREALEQARAAAAEFPPFDIEAAAVQTFQETGVVYLSVGCGAAELKAMHQALDTGALAFKERFCYHPHFTLAQDFPCSDLGRLRATAEARWADYRGPRTFRADALTFVQNTVGNCWRDLAEFALGAVSPVR